MSIWGQIGLYALYVLALFLMLWIYIPIKKALSIIIMANIIGFFGFDPENQESVNEFTKKHTRTMTIEYSVRYSFFGSLFACGVLFLFNLFGAQGVNIVVLVIISFILTTGVGAGLQYDGKDASAAMGLSCWGGLALGIWYLSYYGPLISGIVTAILYIPRFNKIVRMKADMERFFPSIDEDKNLIL